MPVEAWVMRTAVSFFCMCWPPADEARKVSICRSFGSTVTETSSPRSGQASISAKEGPGSCYCLASSDGGAGARTEATGETFLYECRRVEFENNSAVGCMMSRFRIFRRDERGALQKLCEGHFVLRELPEEEEEEEDRPTRGDTQRYRSYALPRCA